MEKRKKVRRLTYAGLLAAIVTLLTAFVKIPIPGGYAHVGDGAVILCGLMLGPYGALPAALGSALADILAGYAHYAVFTAVIKGAMALAAGRMIIIEERVSIRNVLVITAAFAWMVVGYFLFDWVWYGGFEIALASVGWNLIQAAIGMAVSMVILGAGQRFLKKSMRA